MRKLCGLAVVGAVALLGSSAQAGGSSAVTYTGARVHVAAKAVVDFRELAREENAAPVEQEPEESEEAPEPEGKEDPDAAEEPNVHFTVPSPLVSPFSVTSSSTVASPYVSASFLGQAGLPAVGTTKTETPPDTNGAVGRDKLMVPLNSNYVIQRKSDGATLSRVSMTAFWEPVGAHNPFDPRVLYDPYTNRWLASAADDPLLSSSLILYGISDTDDPLGSWHLYAIHSDETGATWADFPTLGFTQSTVAIGVNMFTRSSLTYARGRVIVLDYPSLRAGSGGNPVGVDVPGEFAMQPAVTYSPTEKTIYFVEHLDSLSATYRFWSLNGTTLTLVGGAPKTNPLGAYASPGAFDLMPQTGGDGISAGDARIGGVVFRNGHVWYAQSVGLPPGGTGYAVATAVQWVELDTSGAFVQGGRIVDPRANPWNGGHSYAFGSLAVNARNDVLVGFSEFESDDFADAGYAFRSGSDPPGVMGLPVALKDGEGPYVKRREDDRNRWGDYSGTQVDPTDDLALWTIQEYARVPVGHGDASGRWGVWWGRVGGGPELPRPVCAVPKTVGKKLDLAWHRIAAAHCRLGKVRRVKATKRQRGRVLRQSLAPGDQYRSDTKVDLRVGR
jgi:alkylated DNA nucleotide flippase Atl1